MSFIRKIQEKMLIVAGSVFILSIIGLLISSIYIFFQNGVPDFLRDIAMAPGNWNYWIMLLSALGLMIGGWYFYDVVKKRKKFEELMKTNSKSKFTRNLPELEEISWYLGKEYEQRLEEKKRVLRVK